MVLLVVALVPVHAASYYWRSRLLAGWRGAQARLAEIIADVAVVVVVSEVLGSVHLYRVAPVVITLSLVGLAGVWGARRYVREPTSDMLFRARTALPAPRVANIASLVAASVVIAEWSTKTVFAYHHGMVSTDTLWYHMPFAARFVQDGSITPLHYVDSEPVTVFFPASSELFHSLGILLMGNDVLSPLLNTLWLGLAFLAAWCIGSPFGVAPVTLTGSAILFATPGLVGTQPGGAYDDVVVLALILSSAALLISAGSLNDRPGRVVWVLAAAAAGLAVGTKYTSIVPVVALTAVIWLLARRGSRIRSLGFWVIALLLTGSFWYVRNWFAVGNPIPSFHLKLGPIALHSPPLETPSQTVAQFLFNSSAWHTQFLPGLRISFGPAWWALLALSALGLVLAVVRGDRLQRVLGFVGLAAGVGFVFTPQFLAILGNPVFFVDNVRYADVAVILGLVLLPINPLVRAWQGARWVLVGYVGILVATQFDSSIWPTTFFTERFETPVRGTDALLGFIIGVAVLVTGAAILLARERTSRQRDRTLGRRIPVITWIALGAIVLVAGFPLQRTYLHDRYATSGAFNWFQYVNDTRIAVIGPLSYLQYPLYGKTLSNYVQYLGVQGPHGAYSSFDSCRGWREAVADGHYSYVIITTGLVKTPTAMFTQGPPELRWTTEGRGSRLDARIVTRQGTPNSGYYGYSGFFVYKVGSHFSPGGCGATASSRDAPRLSLRE
jgi:hypothetical protein